MNILRIPLVNVNEEEVEVVDVLVSEGSAVSAGDVVAVIETTKATLEVEAPVSGFIRQLGITEGQRAKVGAVICAITATPDEPFELSSDDIKRENLGQHRATRKASALAEQHGIRLEVLGIDGIIKERDVRAWLEADGTASPAVDPHGSAGAEPAGEHIIIFGAGGHARTLIDLIRESRRDLIPFAAVDDSAAPPAEVLGVPVVGNSDTLAQLRADGAELAVLGIGAVTRNELRIELYQRLLDAGFNVPNLVHTRAMLEPSVRMGRGNQVFAGAIVGSAARLGDNTIINSGVVVSHDCVIGSHSHLTPGAILAGSVTVGENTVVGMGVTVYLGVNIGSNVVIANGVHVLRDVPDGTVLRTSG